MSHNTTAWGRLESSRVVADAAVTTVRGGWSRTNAVAAARATVKRS
jgi:hypothetical protein